MAVGLMTAVNMPQASATTAYTWVHQWDKTGSGVTVQYASANFTRVSYVYGTNSCAEEKLEFWPSGTLALYRRYSFTTSCVGTSWGTARWHTPNAGTAAHINWQPDLNFVLYDGSGHAVWASGTNHSSVYITGERMKLGNDANGYLYLDHFTVCCTWTNDRTYP